MITFYKSNTLNSACGGVIDALGKNNTPGSRHIFIVPDKFSLSIEKEIFERLGLQAAFNIDVVSFMRLTVKALGEKAGKCLSKEGALIVFKKVLNRNTKRLVHYTEAALLPNFASEMYAVITSFRNNCHTPDDILAAARNLTKNTQRKALDIALLYKEYINDLELGYPDSTTRTDKFIAEAQNLDYIKGAHVYIGGFPSFSAKQYEIIAALMRSAQSVSIGVTPDNGGKNSFLYPFHTLERLKDIAEAEGIGFSEIECFEVLKEPFGAINRGLFAFSDTQKAPAGGKLVLFKENTVYDEINGIAKEIHSLVFGEGLRYKDIAIISLNPAYDDIIRTIFARYDIPCFIDKKYRLKDSLIVRHLITALDAAEFGLRQDKVLSYIKNPLSGISPDVSDEFENFVLERCISYGGFLSPYKNASEAVESARQKIIRDLSAFDTGKQPAGSFAAACKTFLSRPEVAETLEREALLSGDAMIAASNKQSADRLFALLDEIGTLIGSEEYPFSECKNILTACISGGEFSLIPQYADSVFVGNLRDSIYDKTKAIFVMGATGDALPPAHSYQAIISAKDSVLMEESGLRLYPTPPDLVKEDMFALLDLFTKVSLRAYFGWSAITPDGGQALPSPVIAELKEITGVREISLAEKHSVIKAENSISLASRAATDKNAFFEFLQLLPKVTHSGDKVSQNLDILYASLPDELKERINALIYSPKEEGIPDGRLYFNKDAEGRYLTKATQLEAYFKCPYLHHLQHGVKLEPRKDGKLQRNNAGTIIHRVLELFFRRTLGKLRDMSESDISRLAEAIINEVYSDPKIVGESGDMFTKNSLESIRRECRGIIFKLAEKVKLSAYTPKLIEYGFGDRGEIIIPAGDGRFVVKGKIDRVDTLEKGGSKKAIVIDYKTGSKKDPDAYFGKSLQLWMYLKALSREGYEPAGAFYLPIIDAPSKDVKPLLLNGYFDADELGNLDTKILEAPYEGKKILSSTINASMTINASTSERKLSKNALDKETLCAIVDYNIEIAGIALKEILEGNIEKLPLENSCNWCKYLLVCGGAESENCRETSSGKLPLAGSDGKEVGDAKMD